MRRRLAVFPALVVLALACGGDGGSGPPPTPALLVAVTSNPIASAPVATVVVGAPTFEVRAANGSVLRNVPVTVAVSAGGGSLAGAPTLSLAGPTPIGQWTLGTTAGAQSVTVTVAGVTPLVFSLTTVAAAPASLQVVEGSNQFGVASTALSSPIRVRVRDAFANNVIGATVNWVVDAGSGNLAAATSVSDAQGLATAPTWTLGAGDGEHAVVASLNTLTVRVTALVGVAPASVTVEVAAPASSQVGLALGTAPRFAVRDAGNAVIVGFPVTVTSGGGGSLVGAPTTTVDGSTAIGTWTMGNTVGTHTVTVTAVGVAPLVFTVEATPGPVAGITLAGGGGQSALAGAAIATAPTVRVYDQFGNNVAGVPVTWAVVAGGGSLGGETTTSSNAGGIATGPVWTLGNRGGFQQLEATAGALSTLFEAFIASNFRVDLRFFGTPPTGAVLEAFTRAANRIQATIIGDIPDVQLTNYTSVCLPAGTAPLTEVLDDVIIYAVVEPIDGVSNVLGSAGPCATRNTGSLTAIGRMRFDSADLDNLALQGRLEAVVLHEMMHVVGIGTLWSNLGLLQGPGQPGVTFLGPLARQACVNTNSGTNTCSTAVPVEDCIGIDPSRNCGAGTQDAHWKETVFDTELMTGYLNQGVQNPFSAMTIQSLADLGYVVNPLTQEAFTVPAGFRALMDLAASSGRIAMPAPLRARESIDRFGRTTPIPDR